MATTVGQHSVATFTSPVNGTTPIDANTVRGNDNTMRTAYVDHDADPGIHVQSSTLASRPVAGTAGRKWITEDSGVYTLWFDDGSNWHPVSSENVALTVLATQALNKGDVVKIVGWNNGQDLPEVAKVSSTSDIAFAVMSANATINTMGYAVNTGIVQDVDTAAFSVGTQLYPSSTGGFTSTKPTSGLYQVVAYVLRANVNGVLYVEFSAPRIVEASANTASTVVLRDASGNFSAGTITANLTGSISGNAATATALQTARNINGVSFNGTADITVTAAAGTLTGSTLASNVVSSSLTSVGTLSNLTVTNPITGSVTGNAATATALQTARNINGVSFNGTADITVTAAAGTLTGNTLASGVTASSLTSVGTLSSLTVSGNITYSKGTLGTGANAPFGNNNDGLYTAFNIGLAGQFTSINIPTTSSALSTTAWWMLGRSTGTDDQFTLRVRRGGTNAADQSAYTVVTSGVDASKIVDNHQWYASSAEQMRLTSTGLGVGTSSPVAKLHVGVANAATLNTTNDGLRITNATANVQLGLTGSSYSYAGIGADAGLLYSVSRLSIVADTNNPITFHTGNAPSERMRLDNSGNLGLGVTPSAWTVRTLQFAGLIGIGQLGFSFNAYYDGAWKYIVSAAAGLYQNSSGAHQWYTAASGTAGNAITFTQAMTLDASGRLGIGATSMFVPLTVASGSNARFELNTAASSITFEALDSARVNSTSLEAYAADHKWFTRSGGSYAERARIGSNGNVSIGTTSTSFKFTVAHSFPSTFTNAAGDFATMVTSTGTAENWLGIAGQTTTDKWVGLITNGSPAPALVFGTGGAERARITSGGYFKASNAGTYGNSNSHEFRQNIGDEIASFANTHSTPNGLYTAFTAASPDNNSNYFAKFVDSTTDRCIIYSDGDLANHDGVYGTISDERLKQDITDASSQWNDLKAVRFRKYRMKTDVTADANAPYQLGVIAQEIEQTSPGLVDEHPNEDGTTTKTVKSSILLMKAAVALQEAMARIETLEQRVMALEA